MVGVHPPTGEPKTKTKKRKRGCSRSTHGMPEKGSRGNKKENVETATAHNSGSDLLCDVRKIVEARLRVKRKNAQSTVLGQLDTETLGIFDTSSKFLADSLLDSASKPPPDPVQWKSHPAIMQGTFSDTLGLRTTLTPSDLKGALSMVSPEQSVASDDNKRAQALLDSICISMVNLLLGDLHAVLGLPCEKLGESFPKTLSSYYCINELTWPELARQCVIAYLVREHFNLSSGILGLIRGGTPSSNESDRHTIHLLRQRVACQYSVHESGGCTKYSCGNIAIPTELDNVLCKFSVRPDAENEEEDSEEEEEGGGAPEFEEKNVLRKLLRFIDQMEQVIRRRCAVVLWNLLERGAGQYFWSEPDNPDYYDVVSQPMCLHMVFCKVVRPASSGGYEDKTIRERFLRDIRLIFENAWCFEDDDMGGKMQATLYLSRTFERLVLEWLPPLLEESSIPSVVSSDPPPISTNPSLSSQDHPTSQQQQINPLPDEDPTVINSPTKDDPSISVHSDLVDTVEKTTGPLLSPSSTLHCVTHPDCCSSPSSPQPPPSEQLGPLNSESVNNLEQLTDADADAAASSLLAAPFMYMCSGCHGGAESDPAVFCYTCEARHHLKCLTPPLETVPSDAWFCHLCQKGVLGGGTNAYGGQVRHNDLLGRPAGHPMELLCGSGQDGRLSRGECEGDVGMGGLTQWGVFSGIPRYLDWTLNAKVGRLLSVEGETRVLLDALRLLSSRDGGFLPSPSAWTPGERVVVMLSLCYAGLRSQSLKQYLSTAEIRCNSLRHSISSNAPNVKSSFLKLLRDVGGDQATMHWKRMLLSGMNDFSDTSEECLEREENLCSSKDFCLVCWHSTALHKTFACGTCQGEVHSSCAMSSKALLEGGTPFYCKHCKTKPQLSQRSTNTTSSNSTSFSFLEDPMFLRDRLSREKVFVDAAIDFVMRQSAVTRPDTQSSKHCGKCSACRARNCRKCSFCKDNPLYGGPGKLARSCIRRQCNGLIKVDWEETLSHGELCAYCGYAEQDLCSSMVVGQTKSEAEWFIEKFLVKTPTAEIPSVPVPYLPLVGTKDARGITGPHVHEVCARLMLRARIEKAQQTLRDLKRRAIKTAIWLSGFCIEPLGVDRAHRVYFRFPGDTSWIYVFCACTKDFNQNTNNTTTLPLTDFVAYATSEVPQLLKWLNPRGICERKLVQALIEAFPEEAVESEINEPIPPQQRAEDSISFSSVGDDDTILLQNHQNKDEEELELSTTQQVYVGGEQSEVDDDRHNGAAAAALPNGRHEGNVIILCEKPGSVLPPTEIVINCDLAENEGGVVDETGVVEILEDQHYCVAVLDGCGKQIHLPQPSVVCFDVLFNGHLVAHKELEHPNGDDNNYYFDAVSFKCIGTFSLNFSLLPEPTISGESAEELLALGVPVASCVVKVIKLYSKTGGAAALKRLRAAKHLQKNSRSASCIDGLDFERGELDDLPFDVSEFEVLRLGIKVVAAALPDGALSEISHDSFLGGFWSPSVREAWISHVREAERCQHIMEALLLLESCVAVSWLQPWYKNIVRIMPGIDSLLRLSTPSAVALRLCLLDQALIYDKQPTPPTFVPRIPRATRNTSASSKTAPSLEKQSSQQQRQQRKQPFVRNTRTSRAANDEGWDVLCAREEDEFEVENSDTSFDGMMSSSGEAAAAAVDKRKSARYEENEDIDYSENNESINESISSSESGPHNGGSEEEEYVDDVRKYDAAAATRQRNRSRRVKVSYGGSLTNGYESENYSGASDETSDDAYSAYSVSSAESDVDEEDDDSDGEGSSDEEEEIDDSAQWPCPTCTFMNENEVTRCTICNALQPRKTKTTSSNHRKKKRK